jgi:alpha-glucosidase
MVANQIEFVYYEDDGLTYDNQNGIYYKRVITFDPQKRELVFGEVEGTFVSKYLKMKVVWHGFEDKELGGTFENVNQQIKIGF